MSASRRSVAARVLVVALGLGVASAQVFAEPPEGKGRNKHKQQKEEHGDAGVSAGALITAGITAAIAHQYALDSGVRMGGHKPLPPGIRKNLARGKPLPPGIAKKAAPSAMLGRLPRHPGYEWQMAGTDLVLVQIGTAIVADVLRDVFR
ncbi:anti-virulence regulator CigR family protein [Azospira restricta]|uniref:Integral membrane protein n=1 Tax=Azospira restricta TaxID=404405 RepID=A0A974PYE6_9RHOO|nr:anti-virulence regulator CigR family protein [Azospira restricta]QRJ63441.1 hypothetical protein IWH25_17120 [Azospira restricta]